jgi:hypothetical protein
MIHPGVGKEKKLGFAQFSKAGGRQSFLSVPSGTVQIDRMVDFTVLCLRGALQISGRRRSRMR